MRLYVVAWGTNLRYIPARDEAAAREAWGALENAGGRKVDRFDLYGAGRKQPAGRRQITARRKHSTLLVFTKERGR